MQQKRTWVRAFVMLLAAAMPVAAQWNPLNPVKTFQKQPRGIQLTQQTGVLRLEVCTPSIIHVTYSPGAVIPRRPDYVVTHTTWPAAIFTVQDTAQDVTLATSEVKVTVGLKDGSLTYFSADGAKLMQDAARTLTPTRVNGEQTYRAEDFVSIYGSREGFYGLGQHQAGVWNYRGESVDLSQENTNIAVPLLVSSNGYGLFWNNTSRTRFNNRFVHSLYISSEVADAIDYYFIFGPGFDRIIAGYRSLTGQAPLFGKWAYGFWQCKNRYKTQQEILAVAHRYRELKIPVDNIVQDWFWWKLMGGFEFNSNYPDPKGMIDDLHRNHFHLMISVWPFFYPGSVIYRQYDQRGWFVARTLVAGFHPAGMALYDATSPEIRANYWGLINKTLFSIGADAWWLDTDEPETEGREENILLSHKLSIGSGARYANIYPLMHAGGVYDGQRHTSRQKRVFILSRSAFAGSQRYAVTAWSGDVLSDFESYKRQIPAGLNFSLSGIPYWTTDIGGFFIGNPRDPAYRELFVRWFQYGAFCPIFRVHGTRTTNENELWSYGPQAQKILVAFDRLRYRLMPYIYSMAWMTTHEAYTPMRPLVMDFRTDTVAQNVGDQFMYGPAILVNPVTEPGAVTRRVYLPHSGWYDFWSGNSVAGGKSVEAAAPLARIPLYVRAGSILPLGPEVQFTIEKPADPIELRIYRGADGRFNLYEDEDDNYNYEKGDYAVIPLDWDDATHKLTIGRREGRFAGMLNSRTFRVVLVGAGHGTGIDATVHPDREVKYSGEAVEVSF